MSTRTAAVSAIITVSRDDVRRVLDLVDEVIECRSEQEQAALDRLAHRSGWNA